MSAYTFTCTHVCMRACICMHACIRNIYRQANDMCTYICIYMDSSATPTTTMRHTPEVCPALHDHVFGALKLFELVLALARNACRVHQVLILRHVQGVGAIHIRHVERVLFRCHRTPVRVHVRACMSICVCVCVRVYVRVCLRACMHVCVRACVHACVRARVRACVHACVRACNVSCT